jgi:AraC-like DNA-binding protein
MSFRTWRQRARVVASLDRVAAGESSKAVALMSGFNSASAFVSAFRQVMGGTPTQFAGTQSQNDRLMAKGREDQPMKVGGSGPNFCHSHSIVAGGLLLTS